MLIAFWCFMLISATASFAQKQTKKDLENKKLQIQKEIEQTNRCLQKQKKAKNIR